MELQSALKLDEAKTITLIISLGSHNINCMHVKNYVFSALLKFFIMLSIFIIKTLTIIFLRIPINHIILYQVNGSLFYWSCHHITIDHIFALVLLHLSFCWHFCCHYHYYSVICPFFALILSFLPKLKD